VSPEEPSARGLNTLCERNVVGQIYNNATTKATEADVRSAIIPICYIIRNRRNGDIIIFN